MKISATIAFMLGQFFSLCRKLSLAKHLYRQFTKRMCAICFTLMVFEQQLSWFTCYDWDSYVFVLKDQHRKTSYVHVEDF